MYSVLKILNIKYFSTLLRSFHRTEWNGCISFFFAIILLLASKAAALQWLGLKNFDNFLDKTFKQISVYIYNLEVL